MLTYCKLTPTQRLLAEVKTNGYKFFGPGKFFLYPWHRFLTVLDLDGTDFKVSMKKVRTKKDVPLTLTLQVAYQPDLALMKPALYPKLPALNNGGWKGIIQWRSEAIVRSMLANYTWQDLKIRAVQSCLEHKIPTRLNEYLKLLGIRVTLLSVVNVELPVQLQHSLVDAEQDSIEAKGRAAVLKTYLDIFGNNLPQVMAYINQ